LTAALEKVTELRPRADWSEPDADSALVVPAAVAFAAASDCVTVLGCASTEPGRGFDGDTARWLWGEFAA
jgi:hypothetical protein